ncbi:MAG: type III pantothenate kinase [Bacteroidetes bacterium]|nr:type III pantothenate kinase [Bacteroidota bacterium]
MFESYPIKHCIVASVVENVEPFIDQLKEKTQTLLFSNQTLVPLINLYQSANTLGSDRLAAAVGGASLFPGKNVVVIDAGTCVKYNFVNSNNEFIGGAISPGLKMRFKALNTFTSKLPLLDVNEKFDTLIGTTTSESILSGVEIGIIAELEGIIDSYKQLFPDINVVLTGGDANFFEKRLKRRIFTDSFLILKGLNCILNHNLKK